jgi:hypothetical protein
MCTVRRWVTGPRLGPALLGKYRLGIDLAGLRHADSSRRRRRLPALTELSAATTPVAHKLPLLNSTRSTTITYSTSPGPPTKDDLTRGDLMAGW